MEFQPTLPARGATRCGPQKLRLQRNFNPRSPHGERRVRRSVRGRAPPVFQPTLPARGATGAGLSGRARIHPISTHAPRTGSDDAGRRPLQVVLDFNPRSPHGERRSTRRNMPSHRTISTHAPRTGSDGYRLRQGGGNSISTHAPRTGSDVVDSMLSDRMSEISTHAPRTGSDSYPFRALP